MIEQKLEELRYYFTGYGSPHDETILKMIEQNKRYQEAIEDVLEIENYGVATDYIKTVTNILLEALEESK